MERKHEFYPMVNNTIKNLITLSKEPMDDYFWILDLIAKYPNYKTTADDPLLILVKQELDRQYARWNKGDTL